ncbi:MAG: hypothetical protein AB3N21_03030 [Ruegeria sp.]|uniref:hypothetical protein n=1 Tax=Ruegeria sp. TaxID=1879320 RepID=UPI00349EE9FE
MSFLEVLASPIGLVCCATGVLSGLLTPWFRFAAHVGFSAACAWILFEASRLPIDEAASRGAPLLSRLLLLPINKSSAIFVVAMVAGLLVGGGLRNILGRPSSEE